MLINSWYTRSHSSQYIFDKKCCYLCRWVIDVNHVNRKHSLNHTHTHSFSWHHIHFFVFRFFFIDHPSLNNHISSRWTTHIGMEYLIWLNICPPECQTISVPMENLNNNKINQINNRIVSMQTSRTEIENFRFQFHYQFRWQLLNYHISIVKWKQNAEKENIRNVKTMKLPISSHLITRKQTQRFCIS